MTDTDANALDQIERATNAMREAELASRTYSYDELLEQARAHAAAKTAIVPAAAKPRGFGPFMLNEKDVLWHVRPDGKLMTVRAKYIESGDGISRLSHHSLGIVWQSGFEPKILTGTEPTCISHHYRLFDDGCVVIRDSGYFRYLGPQENTNAYTKVPGGNLCSANGRQLDYDAYRVDANGKLYCIYLHGGGNNWAVSHLREAGKHGLHVHCPRNVEIVEDWYPVSDGIIYRRGRFIFRVGKCPGTATGTDEGAILRLPDDFNGTIQPVESGCYVEVRRGDNRYVEFHPWQTPAEIGRPPRLIRDLIGYGHVEAGGPREGFGEIYTTPLLAVSHIMVFMTMLAMIVLSIIHGGTHAYGMPFMVTGVVAIVSALSAAAAKTAHNRLLWSRNAPRRLASANATSPKLLSQSNGTPELSDDAAIRDYLLAEPKASYDRLFGDDSGVQRRLKKLRADEVEARSLETQQRALAAKLAKTNMAEPILRMAELAMRRAEECADTARAVSVGLGLVKANYEMLVPAIDGSSAGIALAQRTAALDERVTDTRDELCQLMLSGIGDFQADMAGISHYLSVWRRDQLDAAEAAAEVENTGAAFTVRLFADQLRQQLATGATVPATAPDEVIDAELEEAEAEAPRELTA